MRGFSLLDLMIVLACLALVAMLVIPKAGDDSALRLREAGQLLVADLEFAQARSMGNGADPCAVVFNQATHTYHLANKSAPGVPITDPITRSPYTTTFGRGRARPLTGVTLSDLSVGAGGRVVFTPQGGLEQATAAAITLSCGGQSLRITVDASTGEAVLE